MNRLAQILPLEHVVVGLEATSKKRVLEHIGLLFESTQGLPRALVTERLMARERAGSTCLGQGVAMPHGSIKALKNPLAAVLRLAQPIAFDADDDQPVQLLIALLVPENAAQRHLEMISQVAEMLSDPGMLQALLQSPDAAGLHRLVLDWRPLAEAAAA